MERHFYLTAAAVCSTATAEGAFRQGNVLDDLREVQIDLQQQALAPLTHRTERQNKQNGMYTVCYGLETRHQLQEYAIHFMENTFYRWLRTVQLSTIKLQA